MVTAPNPDGDVVTFESHNGEFICEDCGPIGPQHGPYFSAVSATGEAGEWIDSIGGFDLCAPHLLNMQAGNDPHSPQVLS